jgi:hypothetical protein
MATAERVVTWDQFQGQMARMSGLKFAPKELQTHWEALRDMTEPLLAAAVEHAQKTSDEFPSPKMLRMYADQLRARVVPLEELPDRSTPNPNPVEVVIPHTGQVLPFQRYWRYYCEDCSDSGWLTRWCGEKAPKPWNELQHCGRHREHGAHEWVTTCPCAPTNPDVQRRLERDRRVKRGEGA